MESEDQILRSQEVIRLEFRRLPVILSKDDLQRFEFSPEGLGLVSINHVFYHSEVYKSLKRGLSEIDDNRLKFTDPENRKKANDATDIMEFGTGLAELKNYLRIFARDLMGRVEDNCPVTFQIFNDVSDKELSKIAGAKGFIRYIQPALAQVAGIMTGVIDLSNGGRVPYPRIVIPLSESPEDFTIASGLAKKAAAEVLSRNGDFDIRFAVGAIGGMDQLQENLNVVSKSDFFILREDPVGKNEDIIQPLMALRELNQKIGLSALTAEKDKTIEIIEVPSS